MNERYWTIADCVNCSHLKHNESLGGRCCELHNTHDIAGLFSTACKWYNPKQDSNEDK